jgi:hypothetical protein
MKQQNRPMKDPRLVAQWKEKMSNLRKQKRCNKSGKAAAKSAFVGPLIKSMAVGTGAAKVTIEADDEALDQRKRGLRIRMIIFKAQEDLVRQAAATMHGVITDTEQMWKAYQDMTIYDVIKKLGKAYQAALEFSQLQAADKEHDAAEQAGKIWQAAMTIHDVIIKLGKAYQAELEFSLQQAADKEHDDAEQTGKHWQAAMTIHNVIKKLGKAHQEALEFLQREAWKTP